MTDRVSDGGGPDADGRERSDVSRGVSAGGRDLLDGPSWMTAR
jgi:hypothetical protein